VLSITNQTTIKVSSENHFGRTYNCNLQLEDFPL